MLARVADLGMPGTAHGLVYASLMNKTKQAMPELQAIEYAAGIDWGTSIHPKGSATAIVLGRIGLNYAAIQPDITWKHSNVNQIFKPDNELVSDLVDLILGYVQKHQIGIRGTSSGKFRVSYD